MHSCKRHVSTKELNSYIYLLLQINDEFEQMDDSCVIQNGEKV